ncbi:MAG: hypothetical protein DWQ49_13910 [Bacteroidetes bacterium]|nr:MAG: hypothetical protein DWQ49_13910 [Bacteroidota bacterium]
MIMEVNMEIAKTSAERLALIKKVHARRQKLQAVKAKTAKVRDYTQPLKKSKDLSDMPLPRETNIYAYTDASKYANEYYGETMRETTRFDNDWD